MDKSNLLNILIAINLVVLLVGLFRIANRKIKIVEKEIEKEVIKEVIKEVKVRVEYTDEELEKELSHYIYNKCGKNKKVDRLFDNILAYGVYKGMLKIEEAIQKSIKEKKLLKSTVEELEKEIGFYKYKDNMPISDNTSYVICDNVVLKSKNLSLKCKISDLEIERDKLIEETNKLYDKLDRR